MIMIILGFLLIAIGIIISLPAIGLGTIIPVLGDVADLPVSAILLLIGTVMIFIGGLGYFITQYWWIIVIGFIGWYLMFVVKIGVGMKRRSRR